MSVKLTDQNDSKKFTIENLKKGDLAGAEQIIEQRNFCDIIASTKVEGYFLETKFFLELINKNFQTVNSYIKSSKYELYCSISLYLFGKIQKSNKIFNILNSSSFDLKMVTLTPGINKLNSNFGIFILISSNIEGLNIGDTIKGPISLNVLGDLPARLIKSEELFNLKNIDESKEQAIIIKILLGELSKILINKKRDWKITLVQRTIIYRSLILRVKEL